MGRITVILLDTHVWVWWVQDDPRIRGATQLLDTAPPTELAVSAMSCWEVAVLQSRKKLAFDLSLDEWLVAALQDSAICVIDLTPAIAVESTRLPGELHRDPVDRMLIATARIPGCRLLTEDRRILDYQYVDAFDLRELVQEATP